MDDLMKMESQMVSELTNGVQNHLSLQSVPGKQPFIIGVAGGTASGKTTVCNMIISQLHDQRVVLVNQDSFYHSLSEEKLKNVHEYNFDHPDAFNTELLLSCMEILRHGEAVKIPDYDFKTHKSSPSVYKILMFVLHGEFNVILSREGEISKMCLTNMLNLSSPVSMNSYCHRKNMQISSSQEEEIMMSQ